MGSTTRIVDNYLIYLDGVRVDHLTNSFGTSHGVNGEMPTASLSMVFEFANNTTEYDYESTFGLFRKNMIALKNAIKEKANLLIFVKNVVSGKFHLAFNGFVDSKYMSTSKTRRQIGLTISAIGIVTVLNEIESILSLPVEDLISSAINPTIFRMQARALNKDNAALWTTLKDINLEQITISELVTNTKNALNKTNMVYSNPASVWSWNDPVSRIKVYSDIDKTLTQTQVINAGLIFDSLLQETFYVTMNKLLSRLMMEFYQMPDGEIVIKAPYWNTPVLYDHIIPSIFIQEENFQDRMSGKVTRTLITGGMPTGGLETDQIDNYNFQYNIPMAAYKETDAGVGVAADLLNINYNTGGINDNAWVNAVGTPLFNYPLTGIAEYDPYISTDFVDTNSPPRYMVFSPGTSKEVIYRGWDGTVIDLYNSDSTVSPGITPAFGSKGEVVIQLTDGPYKGFLVVYGGIYNFSNKKATSEGGARPFIEAGMKIKNGQQLGWTYDVQLRDTGYSMAEAYAGDTLKKLGSFYIKVLIGEYASVLEKYKDANHIYICPIVYLRDYYTKKKTPTIASTSSMGIEQFANPSKDELLYGVKMQEDVQPLIRYSLINTNQKTVVEKTRDFAAYKFKSVNAQTKNMTLSTIAMPWIKPGLNVWVDPANVNEVYYVSNISISGGPSGVVMNLGLTMGRDAQQFFTGSKTNFGTVSSGGTFGESIFIAKEVNGTNANSLFSGVSHITTKSDGSNYAKIISKFQTAEAGDKIAYDITSDPLLKEFFAVNSNKSANTGSHRIADVNFKIPMWASEVETLMKNLFASSSSYVVKERAKEVSTFIGSLNKIHTPY